MPLRSLGLGSRAVALQCATHLPGWDFFLCPVSFRHEKRFLDVILFISDTCHICGPAVVPPLSSLSDVMTNDFYLGIHFYLLFLVPSDFRVTKIS